MAVTDTEKLSRIGDRLSCLALNQSSEWLKPQFSGLTAELAGRRELAGGGRGGPGSGPAPCDRPTTAPAAPARGPGHRPSARSQPLLANSPARRSAGCWAPCISPSSCGSVSGQLAPRRTARPAAAAAAACPCRPAGWRRSRSSARASDCGPACCCEMVVSAGWSADASPGTCPSTWRPSPTVLATSLAAHGSDAAVAVGATGPVTAQRRDADAARRSTANTATSPARGDVRGYSHARLLTVCADNPTPQTLAIGRHMDPRPEAVRAILPSTRARAIHTANTQVNETAAQGRVTEHCMRPSRRQDRFSARRRSRHPTAPCCTLSLRNAGEKAGSSPSSSS